MRSQRMACDEATAISLVRTAFRKHVIPRVKADIANNGGDAVLSEGWSPGNQTFTKSPVAIVPRVKSADAATTGASVLQQNSDYIEKWEEITEKRVQEVALFYLSRPFGGECTSTFKIKIPNFSKLELFKKTPQKRQSTVTSNLKSCLAALSAFAGGKTKNLEGCFAVAVPHADGEYQLHSVDKSAHRKAFTAEFGKDGSNGFAGWVEGVDTDSAVAAASLKHIRSRPNMTESITIHTVIHDAPASMRKAWPLSQNTEEYTGSEQCLAIGNQFLKKSLGQGYSTVRLVFDLGGSLEKMVTENKRDKKKGKYTERPFTRGLISSVVQRRSEKYLQAVFGSRDVGRVEFLDVFGAVARNPSEEESEAMLEWFPSGQQGSLSPCASIHGVGRSAEERARGIELRYTASGSHAGTRLGTTSRSLTITQTPVSLQREDTELVRLACQDVVQNKAAEIVAGDNDIWMIGALALATLIDRGLGRLGHLFVHTTFHKVNDSGFESEFINVNELVQVIQEDPRLASLTTGSRVRSVIAVAVLLGGDTTNGWKGITPGKGLGWYLENVAFVGSIIKDAAGEEREAGWWVVRNPHAVERLMKVWYVSLNHAAFSQHFGTNWAGLSASERAEKLGSLEYLTLERVVAKKRVPQVQYFVPSSLNADYCGRRMQKRLDGWCKALELNPPMPPLLGFEVKVAKDGGGTDTLVEPSAADLEERQLIAVWPHLDTKGTPFGTLFNAEGGRPSTTTLVENMNGAAATQSSRLCGSCRHPFHGKNACQICQGTTDLQGKCCVPVCKRCLHEPHKGRRCKVCRQDASRRALCEEHCVVCRHLGTREQHQTAESKCAACGEGEGCAALAAMRMSQGQTVAAAGTAPQQQDNDVGDADLVFEATMIEHLANEEPVFMENAIEVITDAPGDEDIRDAIISLLDDDVIEIDLDNAEMPVEMPMATGG